MTSDSDIEFDESEISDHKKHDQLVEDILSLNKRQSIKKLSRTEPTTEVSEFGLVRPSSAKKGSVHINELTKVLGNRKNQLSITKVVKSSKKKKTLPTPLQKPQAEQIRRTLNYEKSRLQLDKWEALVTANRVANLSFPLDHGRKIKDEKNAEKFPSMWRMKSDLQKELDKLEPVVYTPVVDEETEKVKLTLKELKEKRKEAAKLRAYQSFKEAKLRRQSKIKSKKYHRILKREKIKQQLKEFEELQKTNPEEAMKKLEDIEKARAEERFSLRHKGTGQWAKSKQVRAKYDKESRQVLAQQLAISRELTQKLKPNDSDSENDNMEYKEVIEINKSDDVNPWVNGIKPDKEVKDFVSGFRKYWQEHNQNIVNKDNIEFDDIKKVKETQEDPKVSPEKMKLSKQKKLRRNLKKEKVINIMPVNSTSSTSDWQVTIIKNETKDNDDVEKIFENLENKLSKKIKNKYGKVKEIAKEEKNKLKRIKSKRKMSKMDLTMKPISQKQIIDEALVESTMNMNEDDQEKSVESFQNIKNLNVDENTDVPIDINPNTFMQVETTNLASAIPDISVPDDNEEVFGEQRDLILEAFEDDDIAEDFRKDKQMVVDEDTPKDIDVTLPGWGSWAGTGIKPNKKRLILKMPPAPVRKDQNKGSLIINEKANLKIKPLLVSEVPFPFKTVKDYEASVRGPIGNTFVPERSFKKLIEPNITTKMGAIIEPITKSILMGQKSG